MPHHVLGLTCLLIFAHMSAAVVADEIPIVPRSSQLIVCASQIDSKESLAEFIIIRESGEEVRWLATAVRSREGGSPSGTLNANKIQLSDIFESVTGTDAKNGISVPLSRSYSIVIIDDNGARSSVALTAGQRTRLGTLLRPVFDDILRNGPYSKPNIMTDILFSEDAARSTIK